MARELCDKCGYTIKTCICEYVAPFNHKIRITILQHPSELKSAKNTVKLLQLITSNMNVVIGESEQDFQIIKDRVIKYPNNIALLYPSEKAIAIGTEITNSPIIKELLVIDGTWKKAKKIFLLNPWLNDIQHFILPKGIEPAYGIRKTKVEGGLSTIEAIAYCLETLEGANTSNLFHTLAGFKERFTKHMPREVKERYKL